MTAILCPWSGQYGFRSRLIEVMALGIPVIASPDAVFGMGLGPAQGVFLGKDDPTFVQRTLDLLEDPQLAKNQSFCARKHVEKNFSLEGTYGKLVIELEEWIKARSMDTVCN